MRVSACDSRIAMPLCPQAKKLEAAGKAPPIRRHVDGASVPRVAYVLLLLVNLCHSNSRCTGYRKPAAYTTRVLRKSQVTQSTSSTLALRRIAKTGKPGSRSSASVQTLKKTCQTDFFLCWKSRHLWTALGIGLSSKCLYTAGLRTKDWSSFAELVSDGFLEGRA